jgi:hypothetical protein
VHSISSRRSNSINKSAISQTIAIVVVVIIIVAAAAAVYLFYYSSPSSPPQSFNFGFEATDPTHANTINALNHMSQFNLKATIHQISDPATLTSATANGQVDMMVFQFATTTLNAIEQGANVVAIGEESTAFLQDLVVSSSIKNITDLKGTTMAAFSLDGPVLFPLVWQALGQNFSNYNINLVVIGDSSVKTQALIANKYVGAFLDPADAAVVFKAAPGKFYTIATTAVAFPGIGGGLYFANKSWLNTHFQTAVDFITAVLQSDRNNSANLQSWIQSTYNANFSGLDFSIYNSTQHILAASDYFSPNMITYTPPLMNASDSFLFFGGLINSTGNVNQIYNFSVLQKALQNLGTVKEPSGPYQNDQPLALIGSSFGSTGVLYVMPALEISGKR